MMNPVETFGEVGEVALLARQNDTELLSWEPTDDTRMQALLEQPFSRRQVALYVILKPYFGNLRHGKPADPDAWIAEYVHKRGSWPGIEGEIDSVTELDRAWREEFPDGPDWRDVSDEFGLPGWMDRIDDNRARDENLLRAVLDNVMDGRRVFVIAGSSHAVKLEAALRELLQDAASGSDGAGLD